MACILLRAEATSGRRRYMSQALATVQTESTIMSRERALRILSKSLYRDLRQNGYEPRQIVGLASELIAQVTTDLADETKLD
jgi:hypothetical protein